LSDERYLYSDDSRLMGFALSQLVGGESFLEIGVGNGGNQILVKDKFDLVVGTDIVNLKDVKRENPFAELIMADRASCFQESVFDVVAFNPPYVPSETIVDKKVDGGPNGVEVPLDFLKSALEVVKKSGKILILLSSEDRIPLFQEFCQEHLLVSKKIAERKLFFETLTVFELVTDSKR
jgi:release factor glutamine methyltransferase